MKVGVLLGTAYLFTKKRSLEGARYRRFQQESLKCGDTVLLETGPGHAIRCIPTPYAEVFESRKTQVPRRGQIALWRVGIALRAP